jgi:serine/threonine protein kinase
VPSTSEPFTHASAAEDATFLTPAVPAAPLRPSQPPAASGAIQRTMPATSSAIPSSLIEGYTILDELGRGAMGVVYKARHEKLKRIVALKMILAGPHAGSPHLARFQTEAEAVARLHHAGVVQVYEVGEQDGRPYLALEFINGGNLKDRLTGQPFPPRAVAQFVELLARAMHAAHQRGIIHRDLKPANILLQRVGDGQAAESLAGHREAYQLFGIPKISDFGLAKKLDQQDLGATQQGDVLGTPQYMAPEQAAGRTELVGPAADVYALGAILYEMLTGRPPFQAATIYEVLNLALTQPPVPPRRLVRGLSRDLETICLKCLEKDPHKRYRNALVLAEDLRHYVNGEPIQARAASLPERAWSWCLRNPIAASLFLTVTLVLGLGLWHLSQLSDDLMRARAEKDVHQQTQMLLDTMQCYSQEVVHGARTAGLKPTHDFKGKNGGIPFPVAFTITLSEHLKKNAEITSISRVYSDYPFTFRGPPGTEHLDEWEKESLNKLRARPSEPVKTFTVYNAEPSLRYATPFIMQQDCVKCHNKHPQSPKKDWKVGDVRGVLEVIRPLQGDIDDANNRLRVTYALLGGTAVGLLALCGLVLTISRRYRRA